MSGKVTFVPFSHVRKATFTVELIPIQVDPAERMESFWVRRGQEIVRKVNCFETGKMSGLRYVSELK
jgi:hypothetical protein